MLCGQIRAGAGRTEQRMSGDLNQCEIPECLTSLAISRAGSLDKAKASQIEKDAPQPQVVVALGLLTTNLEPSRPSE